VVRWRKHRGGDESGPAPRPRRGGPKNCFAPRVPFFFFFFPRKGGGAKGPGPGHPPIASGGERSHRLVMNSSSKRMIFRFNE